MTNMIQFEQHFLLLRQLIHVCALEIGLSALLRGSVNPNLLIGQAESIPNITGSFTLGSAGINSAVVGYCGGSGAFYSDDVQEGANIVAIQSGTTTTESRRWGFDASKSSATFKNGAHVQPNSLVSRFWLRRA